MNSTKPISFKSFHIIHYMYVYLIIDRMMFQIVIKFLQTMEFVFFMHGTKHL
uniref:Uncharacterized protein n=1 Tax=Anguilla anguilla TaxID=7936 RepID=A0A0E9XYB4_ANGAN